GFTAKSATVDLFRKMDVKMVPGDGFLSATVPAMFGSWAFALQRFGTLTLRDVLEPSIELAEGGFPMYRGMRGTVSSSARRFRAGWPGSAALYLPDGQVKQVGDIHKNPDWAATVKKTVEAEAAAKKHGREDAIQAAIDYWYKGEVAAKIVEYLSKTSI